MPVAHKVCDSAGKSLRDITTPPTSRPRPVRKPMATRSCGGMRLLSNEYLTKNATPRNSASPPSHAKPFTPMNCSQLIAGAGLGGGVGAGLGSGGGVDATKIGGVVAVGGRGGEIAATKVAAGVGGTAGTGVTIFVCVAGAS